MRYLVAIPVYNEATTLGEVLAAVRPHTTDILVVDDGSTDHTRRILAANSDIHTVRHTANRGYGQSLIDAFTWAACRGYDWIITMDCDGQHEPQQIGDFVRATSRNDADIISGSRYLRPMTGDTPAPPDRRAINQRVTDLLNELLGVGITDAFCGFKAYRLAGLASLHLTVPGYGMPLQLWVQAVRAGLRIREIPVHLIYHDLNRRFGGTLDDPDARLLYYYEVLLYELASPLPAREAVGLRAAVGGAKAELKT